MTKVKINAWARPVENADLCGNFLMLPPELLQDDTFNSLKPAAKMFYISIMTYRETVQGRATLLDVLRDYCRIGGVSELETLTDFDIENEANPKGKYQKGYFVFPEAHIKEYGFKPSYAKQLKEILIDKGFIRIVAGGKGKKTGYQKNATLYAFDNRWKHSNNGDTKQ